MRRATGFAIALIAHAAILLFGGIFFMKPAAEQAPKIQTVDLLEQTESDAEKQKKEQKAEQEARETEKKTEAPIEVPDEAPDMRDLARLDAAAVAPALDALSLSALEGLLQPEAAGAGDVFSGGGDLSSGGRIGGTGKAVAAELEQILTVAEMDQKPRPIFQAAPAYPFDLRRKKVEGTVMVRFVVDEDGHVAEPTIERSAHPEFEKPALEAVRQWRFEPAVRGGQKVKCKMRVPLRFSVS